MFCRWLYRRRRFPELFRNEPLEVEEHIILTCRAISESKGNECAMVEPIVTAVSLCLRPQWVALGVGWVEAFDQIPLAAMLQTLVDLFGEKAAAQHFPGVLKRKLWQAFGPDVVVGAKPAKPAPKPPRALTRVAGVEKYVRLGLDLLELRSAIKSNGAFGHAVRHRFNVDGQHACEVMKVARTYGGRPEIFTRLSWNALLHLASPTLPAAARASLESRILAGERVGAPEIRASRDALRPGSKRRQADQRTRMAA
jgi:hypothetical protein